MALGRTDGAPDPIDQDNAWESVFAEGASFGEDAAQTLTADLGNGTPQGETDESSDGPGATGSPSAPQPSATGDESPATSPEPPDASLPAPESPDPLAGAEPFTYTVGNETRTIEGAYRLPGDGLYVPEDKVPQFQLIASRAETLQAQNRELYDRSQQWDRLTSWQIKDAQGATRTITGQPALEAQRVALARTVATLQTLEAQLTDRARFHELVSIEQGEDGQYYAVPNPQALQHLQRDAELAAIRAEGSARSHFATVSAPPPPQEAPAASLAMPTIEQFITDHAITGLTQADKQFLATQFAPYVTTTPQGRAVNPLFLEVMKERASMRSDMVKAASAAKQADTFNRGVDKGRQPAAPVRPAAPPSPVPTGRNAPKVRTEPNANDMWSALYAEAQTGA